MEAPLLKLAAEAEVARFDPGCDGRRLRAGPRVPRGVDEGHVREVGERVRERRFEGVVREVELVEGRREGGDGFEARVPGVEVLEAREKFAASRSSKHLRRMGMVLFLQWFWPFFWLASFVFVPSMFFLQVQLQGFAAAHPQLLQILRIEDEDW